MEQEAQCARIAANESELHLIGQRAAQERDAKMNEEIQIARDRSHKGNVLHERITQRDQEFDDVIRELAASRQKASDAQSGCLNQIAEMAEEIEEARHEIEVQQGFVSQVAETNTELESENTTHDILGADSNDRGQALLRGDSDRTGKRHNSKTCKSNTTDGLQHTLYQAKVATSSSSGQSDWVLFCFLLAKTQ